MKQYLMQVELQRLRTENHTFQERGCCQSYLSICDWKQFTSWKAFTGFIRSVGFWPSTGQHFIAMNFVRPQIHTKLQQKGSTISDCRLLRLIKELGLSNKSIRSNLNSSNDRQYHDHPNKFKRNFLTDALNMFGAATLHTQGLSQIFSIYASS